jgi:hypothetical protein
MFIQGFYFINRNFMVLIQIAVTLSIILIITYTFLIVIKIVNPYLKLKFSRSKRKQERVRARKYSESIGREVRVFLAMGFLLLGSNIMLISIPFPTHKIVPIIELDADEYLMDLHVHTIYSDGWLTPEERVAWYMNQGIKIAAFSDHDNLRGALIARSYVERNNLDFHVLIAEEWTDHENDIHMNYYGVEEELVPLESQVMGGPKAFNASDLIAYVKSKGGYVTVNHYNYEPNPNGGFGVPYSLEQLRDWGVDGFEIVNSGNFKKYEMIREFCVNNSLICMGGSDTHINEDLNTFIRIRLTDPTNFSVDNIFTELKKNTHQVVAIQFFPEIVNLGSDWDDIGFYVFEEFINYILHIDMFQAISWIAWSSMIYVILIILYFKIRNTSPDSLKNKMY